ncbi:SRPBCC domain-containing protein [Paenibacillus lemnae]|uniref:SRPBCC domain-containing protein n=1 Tax=Paenibacillus lemnae TaxID=1330551 RepID=A0A848M3W0_PAELE|nr:SRPBCC domain-containing protein [Paenibacillus lemnae]NMO94364.1 SRPBCC domain-containing protein [Paenibacillus lemnae]
MSNQTMVKVEGNELILERVFQAPRELVFKMFSEAEHLKHWWGPRGWELTKCDVDFRPGGVWHYCMKCMDPNQGDFYGFESWGKGVYQEIHEPQEFVYIDYFSDAQGNESKEMPATLCTMTFIEEDGATRLINRSKYDEPEQLQKLLEMGMEQGTRETWDRLDEYLQTQV